MSAPTIAVIAAAIAVVAAAGVLWTLWRGRRRVPLLVPVTVNTRRPDDQSIAGLLELEELHGRRPLHLRSPRYLERDGTVLILERDVYVPRDAVAWVQELAELPEPPVEETPQMPTGHPLPQNAQTVLAQR